MNMVRLYFRHAAMHIRAAMEYKTSFRLTTLTQVLNPVTSCLGVTFFFQRFGAVGDWSFPQVLLCFAVAYMSYGLAEAFCRGYDSFSGMIRKGTFDRLLVQPRSIVGLVFCSEFAFNRIGKLVFALLLLVYAAVKAGIAWTWWKIATLLMMVVCGTCTFGGLFIAFATLCFWTVEGIEVTNVFTDGGREMSSYPLDIYAKPIRRFFTWVVPFASMNVLPLTALLDKGSPWLALTTLAGLPFLLAAVIVFKTGVTHYRSAG